MSSTIKEYVDNIKNVCVSIFDNKDVSNINYFILQESISKLQEYDEINNKCKFLGTIYKVTKSYVKQYKTKIQEYMKQNYSCTLSFMMCWEDMAKKINALEILNKNKEGGGYELPIKYIATKLFHDKIVNRRHDGQWLYLNILNDLEQDKIAISQYQLFIDAISLYETFKKIEKSKFDCKLSDKCKLWRVNNYDKEFLIKLISSKVVVEKYVLYLHNLLIELPFVDKTVSRSLPDDAKSAKSRQIEIIKQINSSVNITYYFQDKIFLYIYLKKQLEIRLLESDEPSFTIELEIVNKFATNFGWNIYLETMHTMIQDIKESKFHNDIFYENELKITSDKYLPIKNKISLRNIAPNIIKAYIWQINEYDSTINGVATDQKIKLPLELDALLNAYFQFFSKKFPSHRIDLRINQGFGIVTIKGKDDFPYNLYVNTKQLIVLLMFQSKKILLNTGTISKALSLTTKSTDNILDGLYRSKVLVKSKGGGTEPFYKLNENFTYKERNIQLTNYYREIKDDIQPIDDEKNEIKVVDAVSDKEKQYYLQANIVSILKDKKKLTISQLFAQISTKFTLVSIHDKLYLKCLEKLESNDYIEQSKDKDNHIITYLD